jgi:hypothetical protein
VNRLRTLRPTLYVQVPHAALDALPDLNSPGLLAHILRHDDDWDFSLDRLLASKAGVGKQAGYKAMRTLVAYGYIVKVKWQDAGGHWHTEMFRSADPHTDADLAEIAAMFTAGTATTIVRIKHGKARQVATTIRGGALVVSWRGDEKVTDLVKAQFAPTSGFPTVGEPTTGGPTVGFPAVQENNNQNNNKNREGEEGARAREIAPPVDNSGGWGVPARPAQAPDVVAPGRFCQIVIGQIAEETGLGLTPKQHERLATEHMPTALAAVKALGDPAISSTELCEWLRQGHHTTQSLYAILRTRLDPDYLKVELPAWVARQNAPQQHAPAPQAPPAPPAEGEPEPFTRGWKPAPCRRHPGSSRRTDGECAGCWADRMAAAS